MLILFDLRFLWCLTPLALRSVSNSWHFLGWSGRLATSPTLASYRKRVVERWPGCRPHNGVMRVAEGPGLDHCDSVIWELEARDPMRCAPGGVAEATEESARALASSLGCTLVACTDDDSYDDQTPPVPYYSWLVRVPRDEHEHRDEHDIPVAVAGLHQHLRSLLPTELEDWHIAPDRGLTLDEAAGTALRGAYLDLLEPFEAALMPLRTDGAERLEHQAKAWVRGERAMAGTYSLWLCDDPDAGGHAWLVLRIGLAARDSFWQSPTGRDVLRWGVTVDDPVLMTPDPPRRPGWSPSPPARSRRNGCGRIPRLRVWPGLGINGPRMSSRC